ncbi:hypothetical protein QR680_014616 [Steinernema hermaphroditum]|uniref:DUF7778 domain-containing protein n=1 Tax=Steinernema hermaphroditum TaxID=289476 RepID=A0AA39I9J4_9BILA|nr:hypothetical protein QR680_014616 [Steinernema hermaphroditum]
MERLEDEPGDFIDSRDLFKPEPLPFCSTWRFDPRTIEKDMVVVQRCYRLIREQPAPKFCALVEHYLLIYENYDTGCVVDLCHVKFLKIKKAKENTTNSRATFSIDKMNHFSIGHSSGTKVVLHFGVLGKTFEQWAAAFKDVVYSHLVEDVTDTSFLDVSTTKRVAALRPRDFNESSFFIEPEDKENNGFLKRVGSRFKKKRSKSSAQSCDRFNDSKMTDFNGTLNTTVLFNKTDPCFSKSLDVSHAVDKKAFYKRGPFKWMSKKKNWDASSGFDSVDAGNCSTISSFKSDIIPSKTPRRNSICFDPVVVEIPPSKFDPVDNDSGIFTSDSHSPDEQEHSPSPPTPQYNLSLPLFKMEEVYPRIQIDLSADIKRLCEDEFPGSSVNNF